MASSPPWEEEQTEPLLGRRRRSSSAASASNDNYNLSPIRQSLGSRHSLDGNIDDADGDEEGGASTMMDTSRASLDADTTLPLPAHVQAQVDDIANNNNNNNNNAAAVVEAEEECERLSEILTTKSQLTEENAARLLSYLTRLRTGGGGGGEEEDNANVDVVKWNAKNVRLTRLTVQSAMISLNSNNNNNDNTNNNGSDGGKSSLAVMESKMARRLLTDGILSFASSSSSMESLNAQQIQQGNETDTTTTTTPAFIWIAKLIRSIVIEDLLPTAVLLLPTDDNDTNSSGNTIHHTCALEILLGTFLSRMDADEQHSQKDGAEYSVDDILDRLCGVQSSSTEQQGRLRPSATAAVLSSLREFESNSSSTGALGRLSKRRVWKKKQSGNDSGRGGSQFAYIDRPTFLLHSALASLKSLSSHTTEGGDPDMLPPLVYQLGLTPMSVISRGGIGTLSSSLVGDKKKENEKHRGIRLRRMCLEGIASVLDYEYDDTSSSNVDNDNGIVLNGSSSSNNRNNNSNTRQEATDEAFKWARYTSLTHLGNCLRSDPEMSKAVLSMLSGEIVFDTSSLTHNNVSVKAAAPKPFRYARLTPFRLAMGLSMASSVPRMRSSTLEAIRDLILEEETIRIRRGLDVGRKNVIGMGRPWMDCLVRCLEGMEVDEVGIAKKTTTAGSHRQKHHDSNDGIGHVLQCLISVAKFAESEHNGSGGGGSGGAMGGTVGGGCASSLLQSLSQLGFLLIDCVKNDPMPLASASSSSANSALRATAVLAPNLDISSFNSSSSRSGETSATHATATTGRYLLCYLFYQSAAASSHLLSSSLSSLANNSNSNNNASSSSDNGGTALCRSILRTSFDKFCGMAPNAMEHALLLMDLLKFSPCSISGNKNSNEMLSEGLFLDNGQKEEVIALSLTSNHLPSIIDTLSNVPGGGLSPHVAAETIIPALGRLLLLQATSPRSAYSLWKRTDLEDHVDHAFLLAKKSLFSADVEKRKCAATLLVTLLGVASVAASANTSSSATSSGRSSRSRSVWSSMLYDMKGCLRRCLTQHQSCVRMEAYSSLVALLPKSVGGGSGGGNTQDSNTTSPAASTTSGGRTPSPASSSPGGAYNKIVASIPPSGQHAVVCIVSELLLSSLERYVTIPKEELTDRDARRERSAAGVGLSQMEMVVEEEEESPSERTSCKGKSGVDNDDGMSNPFRFEKFISTRRPSSKNMQDGKKKKSKAVPIGATLLTEALDRINEPLSFLIASCIAVTPLLASESDAECDDDNNDHGNSEMKKALKRIRQQMARCTDMDEYLKWIKSNKSIFDIKDNAKRAEEMAIAKLATLVTVAVTADVFLNTCEWSSEESGSIVVENTDGDVANDIEDLFTLRTDAIDEAAIIMSSFVTSKPNKKATATTAKNKAKKKLQEKDVNNLSSSQTSENEPLPPDKKQGKSSSSAGAEEIITKKVKTSEINDSTRAKNRKLIEDVVNNLCPAMCHDYLTCALRKFGSEVARKVCDDVDSDDDDDDDTEAATRLTKCLAFRRYIITKSLLLTSGSSSIIIPGARFGPIPLGSGGSNSGADAMDEMTASSIRIAASLKLGPLLFAEFCTHCYELERTSIVTNNSKSSSSATELPLAQLSMRAFTTCVRGMAFEAPHNQMSKASRVNALFFTAMRKASAAAPSSADGWKFYQDGDTSLLDGNLSSDEITLGKTLLPILSLGVSPGSTSDESATTHLCLFSELLSNCMYGEAIECCYLISSTAEAFSEPNIKEQLGVTLLRGFEFGDGGNVLGVLNLDHSDESNDNTCVSSAIGVAMKLNCGLDGNTHVPLPGKALLGDRLRAARSNMGLPTTTVENWPERHRGRLEKELLSASGMIGIGTQISWALSATLDIGKNFRATFDKNSPTKRQLKLALIKAAAQTSDANFAKEKSSIASTISSSIDDALNNADFAALKIPHMSDGSADLAQRFVSSLLFSVSKMISASAPSAEFLDVNGSFASKLILSCKRLYGILAKLILSFMNNPQSLTSKETKCFLDYLTATLMPRVSALLMTLQEKQETAGGKFLAESKIESHGKTSALLVFEKEKLDNALLKVGTKLKQAGLEDDSEWLEDHVVSNLNRDFVIRRVEDAKAREAPKTAKKPSGAKRKVKSEQTTSKKSKKKKRAELEEENDSEADEGSVMESVDADESMDEDGEDVISLDRLTAKMKEEGEDSDSEDEDSEDQPESEDEAEFDE